MIKNIFLATVWTVCVIPVAFGQEKPTWLWYISTGYNGDAIPRPGKVLDSVPIFPGWDFDKPGYGNPFLELGFGIEKKRWSVVTTARTQFGRTNPPPSTLRPVQTHFSLSPNLYAHYYFGKYDKRGFRVGVHSSLLWYRGTPVFFPAEPNPAPNPNYPRHDFYFLNGIEVGTRVIRNGIFANTYLNASYQVGKGTLDNVVSFGGTWYGRVSVGLSKSIPAWRGKSK